MQGKGRRFFTYMRERLKVAEEEGEEERKECGTAVARHGAVDAKREEKQRPWRWAPWKPEQQW